MSWTVVFLVCLALTWFLTACLHCSLVWIFQLQKSLCPSLFLSASNSSPVAEYNGFAKLCICLLLCAYIFVHLSSSLLHGSRCRSSVPLTFCYVSTQCSLCCNSFLLCRTLFLLFPPPWNLYTSIPRSVINENINNLPVVEVTRLVTNITTLLPLCFLCFISTL